MRYVAEALNATAAGPFTWLRSMPHGPALAAVAKAYTIEAWQLLRVLAAACHWPNNDGRAPCKEVHSCLSTPLRESMEMLNSRIQRQARGVVRNLCRAGASAGLVAMVAAVDSQASNYFAVTTECVTLRHVLDFWLDAGGGECAPGLHDVGVQCAHSLFQAARLSAGALWDFLRHVEDQAQHWNYVGAWGSNRLEILSNLLVSARARGGNATAVGEDADEGTSSPELRAAEVGVFQANTSRLLLERFPGLHMLLVDPYHLHMDDPESEHQQLQEFYVSSEEVFDKAVAWTQPYRERATFVMQGSAEAAAWVAPGSLDLVFIDGDHRYKSVVGDIFAWWPTLRVGGVLAGHDFALTFPGVVEAVTKFSASNGLSLFVAPEIWWVVRPPEGPASAERPQGHGITSGEELSSWLASRGYRVAREGKCILAAA
eukprot:CAMPEP_0117469956 /NCGR_PEP_ID=MMETSP0784-20121206/6964_1 /TAXON_ID=39447 /ORGANISM="" /LENGTH=428 /DNA_ID=CAMNT_0005264023 /DNA_START=13 /DNA_END=1295 /DNA_ORIENTATION=+